MQRRMNKMAVSGITETRQYLTFILDGELFALDISKVRDFLYNPEPPLPLFLTENYLPWIYQK